MKLLVIEDDVMKQQKIKDGLEKKGIEVTQVFDHYTARKLLRLIEENKFDCILLDGIILNESDRPDSFIHTDQLLRDIIKCNPKAYIISISNDPALRLRHVAIGKSAGMHIENLADKEDIETIVRYLSQR